MTATALIVDDEVDLCRLMQITLTKMGIQCDVAYTLTQAQDYWKDNSYDFCLTDLKLPDGSGLDLVKQISNSSTTPVAVITAFGSMDLAIEALKLGAFDFVNKPLELPRLRQLVENALKVSRQDNDIQSQSTQSPEQQLLDSRLIGNAEVMQTLKKTILKLARSQAPVFLSGASGTGKEVVARLIHDLSPRCEGSFVPVNCGAIPSELMESEFFGHKKGSFTGAVADKQGLFQQANGGTLFLDEVADLPLPMQVKLLRAIQEKTVRAIGDTKELPVDIRILSATHKNLSQLVAAGEFRQDLYYRINVIELKLPALNDRRDDIPALAEYFLGLIAEEWQLESAPQLSAQAYQRLQDYAFAGNVRELRNILERAITLCETEIIDVSHLGLMPSSESAQVIDLPVVEPDHSNDTDNAKADVKAVTNVKTATHRIESNVKSRNDNSATGNLHPYRFATNAYSNSIKASSTVSGAQKPNDNAQKPSSGQNAPEQPARDVANNPISLLDSSIDDDIQLPASSLEIYLQDQERRIIVAALKQTEGNKTQAAELLGTSFRSLRYRMKKLEIDEDIC
ncbi:sigma-54 dependent transcriptional regulator [Psychrobacter sp. M13]|uniref:sigma-54-dependent transcriptional regulator n=1 Tax=Psychrobacter sp. M13 TaxID=3067275 RepID=UPI00273B4BC5|nr:sigma-54 dependent transcriptional regulator [Psychrobacter sp. M13]WLP95263.1 sigma-54 dependent transcriptional regulator [Psychrobacter sp. M13]